MKILTKKQGEKGFGYDPIFKPEGFNQSFAKMTSEEKNKDFSQRNCYSEIRLNFLLNLKID